MSQSTRSSGAANKVHTLQPGSGVVPNVVIGMPHRGRLNLLIGLLEYPPEALFHKLAGNAEFPAECAHMTGDVISHIAHQAAVPMASGSVNVTLLPNSSHLEAVNPVAVGSAYAMKGAVCLQIHGDAAVSGQVSKPRRWIV